MESLFQNGWKKENPKPKGLIPVKAIYGSLQKCHA